MPTIFVNQPADVIATVKVNGVPLAIATDATVTAQLLSINGMTTLAPSRACASDDPNANWAAGVVATSFTQDETSALPPGKAMLVISGPGFIKRFEASIEVATTIPRSLLFIRDIIVDELRGDQLLMAAQNHFANITLSDDAIWDAVKAAEAQTARDLRVPLVPTQFFANPPTPDQIAAVPPGMPYEVDPAYDYDPDFFTGEKWGFLVLRQKPIVSVSLIRFVYPAPTIGFYDIPADWLRLDRKYAHIRFVPASSPFVAPLNAFILQALGGGRTIPFAIEVTYIAGLTDPWTNYPDLIDVIKKRAVLKLIEGEFLPQSGSISADGLSQSQSIDMEKYRDTIDVMLYGPKGANGGLMTAIHGIRMSALGQ